MSDMWVYILGQRNRLLVPTVMQKGNVSSIQCSFRKVGKVASPDVVVQLVKTKCLPILYYATEVCPTNKSDVLSLQYVIDTCFRKIFHVKSKDVVRECETEFGVLPVTDVIDIRKRTFIVKYDLSDNLLCSCSKIVTILFVILCQYS